MPRLLPTPADLQPFDAVRVCGLRMPDVTAETTAGWPVLKRGGCFMAGLAKPPLADTGTLVVRYDETERDWLLEDAPEVYYLPEPYRRWPVILARLSRLTPDALRDLLAVSWRLTGTKVRRRAGYPGRESEPRRSR